MKNLKRCVKNNNIFILLIPTFSLLVTSVTRGDSNVNSAATIILDTECSRPTGMIQLQRDDEHVYRQKDKHIYCQKNKHVHLTDNGIKKGQTCLPPKRFDSQINKMRPTTQRHNGDKTKGEAPRGFKRTGFEVRVQVRCCTIAVATVRILWQRVVESNFPVFPLTNVKYTNLTLGNLLLEIYDQSNKKESCILSYISTK